MPSQAEVRRAELARERRSRPVSVLAIRLAELNRLLTDRHRGEVLQDDDDGRHDAETVAHHLARCSGNPRRRIESWLHHRTPWMPETERAAIIDRATTKTRRWRADTLAKRLNLTAVDRQRLRITTIGAVDANREARAAARARNKRKRDRDRARDRRRAAGRQTRDQYLATKLSRARPWIAQGISRRTWERRRETPQVAH
jgi:hypothetical protein